VLRTSKSAALSAFQKPKLTELSARELCRGLIYGIGCRRRLHRRLRAAHYEDECTSARMTSYGPRISQKGLNRKQTMTFYTTHQQTASRKKICKALSFAISDLEHLAIERNSNGNGSSNNLPVGQFLLILRRISRGISPGLESFLNLIRAGKQRKSHEARVTP